jgi:hypothetical protein
MSEHIVINDVAPRVQYVGNGTLTQFGFPFAVFDAAELEVRVDGVALSFGYSVAGTGTAAGGTVTFEVPPRTGAPVTLRRAMRLARVTDFQDNGVLRARTLNDELDYQTAAIQQVADEAARAIRLSPDDTAQLGEIPPNRGGKLLGFDPSGRLVLFPPALTAVPLPENGMVNVRRDFGAVGDGIADDTAALQAAFDAAALAGRTVEIPEGTYRTTGPIALPGGAPGLTMRGTLRPAGGFVALTLGDGGALRNGEKTYDGIRVHRATQSDWSNDQDIGVRIRNVDVSTIRIIQAEGFTIGVQTLGDGRGVEDSSFFLGRIVNNRIGLDIRTATAAGWNTSLRYHGGHFAMASGVNVGQDRFGVRFSAAPGAYAAHNRHVFDSPSFELRGADASAAIPFLSEVNSRSIIARGVRMEGCSAFVARHTAGAQDHEYEVAWASQAYGIDVDYAPSATRAGAVVRRLHQAAAHTALLRPVGDVPNLRAAAFRWSNTEVGFDRLACLSSAPAGTPTALAQFAFPGLDSFPLSDRGVVLTAARGLGFVVDARAAREFALAVDADPARLVVQCFDAAGTVLTDAAGPLVRASGQSMVWNGTARWWQGSADMSDAALTRPQAVRLGAAVATAIIGVARGDADAEARAMRLFCDPLHAPALIFGQPGLPHGRRELLAEAAWDPPSIAAGGTAQLNVGLAGARPGDAAQAAFSLATSAVLFLAQVGATDVVTVTAWNRSGGAVDLGAGTVRVRLVKA